MTRPSVLSEEALAKAAFRLLTSSALDRYARMARLTATEAGLVRAFGTNRATVPDAVARARDLWVELTAHDDRDASEIELAVLLVALSDAGVSAVDPLLADISASGAVSAHWVGALAKHLLRGHRLTHRRLVDRRVGLWSVGAHRCAEEYPCT